MKFYSTKETCEILRIGRDKLRQLREEGAIDYIQTGRGYVYTDEGIRKFYETFKNCNMTNIARVRKNTLIRSTIAAMRPDA